MIFYITENYGGGTIYWTKIRVNVVIGCYCDRKLYLLEHIFPFNMKPGFDIINFEKMAMMKHTMALSANAILSIDLK